MNLSGKDLRFDLFCLLIINLMSFKLNEISFAFLRYPVEFCLDFFIAKWYASVKLISLLEENLFLMPDSSLHQVCTRVSNFCSLYESPDLWFPVFIRLQLRLLIKIIFSKLPLNHQLPITQISSHSSIRSLEWLIIWIQKKENYYFFGLL